MGEGDTKSREDLVITNSNKLDKGRYPEYLIKVE
jgi:hypothetical protein